MAFMLIGLSGQEVATILDLLVKHWCVRVENKCNEILGKLLPQQNF